MLYVLTTDTFNVFRLFSRQDVEPSENTASRISAGSKFSTKDDFLTKYPVKNIVELLDVETVYHTYVKITLLLSVQKYEL